MEPTRKNVLLSAYNLNPLFTLKNRIVMAPMTRSMATDDFIPTPQMAAYYQRRAEAGLLITEGAIINEDATGYRNVPGIFTEAQCEGWRLVADKVHENEGLIFMQLWHVGRVSHPDFLHGKLPLSPSETVMKGRIPRGEGLQYGKSRAATCEEIESCVCAYASAAILARHAGFDGIEIHGANGYLVDQFLHHQTNLRTDAYGGTPQKMAKFALDVVTACGNAIGFERVGIRLSPAAYVNEIIGQVEDALVFQFLLEQLSGYPLAYVHTGNFNDAQTFPELGNMTMSAFIRKHYKGKLIACGKYTLETANQGIENHDFDLVAIGRPFLANPDLIHRFQHNEALQEYEAGMLNTLY